MAKKTHIIAMLVEDHPGVMTRVAGLFARRGFNIDTITVGKTNIQGVSKMVFTVTADESILEQVTKQVNKLVDVIKVSEMGTGDSVIYELCLVKVSISSDKAKEELLKYADIYKTKVADITPKSIIFQLVGTPDKIDSFLDMVKRFGIIDISRTGVTGLVRGVKAIGDK